MWSVSLACLLLIILASNAVEISDEFTTEEPSTTPETEAYEETTENVLSGIADNSTEDFTGAQLYSVKLKTAAHKNVFQQLQEQSLIDVWLHVKSKKSSRAEFMVMSSYIPKVLSMLYDAGIQPKIVIPNMQRLIEKEKMEVVTKTNSARAAYKMNWNEYHRYDTIHALLLYYANEYPDTCTLYTIGKTVEDRDIQLLKISSGGEENKPAVFIDGGMHAREWISPAVVTYIIKELVERRGKYRSFINDVDFHVLPIVNVDGYEYSHTRSRLWRKNRASVWGPCSGVDLNRNFGYKWAAYFGTHNFGCSEDYRGTASFSEPESKAIRDYIMFQSKANYKAYLSFHSYGQMILYPYGYASGELPPDADDLERVGKAAANAIQKLSGTIYKSGNSAKLMYRTAGTSDDWAKGEAGIKYSYVIELSDKGRYGFTLPAKFIKPTGADAMEIVKVVANEINQV
ncbi:Hypothetical predicted protein [Cloeon dipterum]|uniref:Peptidase M14 domain-containing protein n=1 Tax=Cloeon dipterum TaxID=197152 RepID=A0A8S1DVC4_9INSE|nr:Hypothetical predicted protein [Cloeon dipterum]